MTAGDDNALIERLGRGETRAFDELYELFADPLYAFLLRMARSEIMAEEVFQETWIRVAKGVRSLHRAAPLRAWMFTVARNTFYSARRWSIVEWGRARPDAEAIERAVGDADPERSAIERDAARALERALAAMPTKLREALVLSAIAGLSGEEGAGVCGVSEEAFRARVSRARKWLGSRHALEERGERKWKTARGCDKLDDESPAEPRPTRREEDRGHE